MRMRHAWIAALLLAGCSKEVVKTADLSEPVLTRQYRKESVTVIFSVSETNITTAGSIRLLIDVHAAPGEEVVFPEIENHIESFSVADGYGEPLQTLPNGKHLHRRVWKLVPDLPGEQLLKSLQLQAGSTLVETEPVSIHVESLLPTGLTDFQIKDIAAPTALFPEQTKQRDWVLKSLAGLIGLFVVAVACKARKRTRSETAVPPYEAALQLLEQLPEEDLARIDSLSTILLGFVGGWFGLPTTGKTIHEIGPLLAEENLLGHGPELERLLVEAEQIRFSNKVPPGFADELESFVRSFVETSKEEPCD